MEASLMKNISELNGLRGVAVLSVFFHHAFYATLGSSLSIRWGVLASVLARVFQYGDAGVDLFFVLSGFLITSLLLRNREEKKFYQDFYWKRLLRIGPVFFVALGITLALHEFRYALLSVFFLANFGPPFHIFGTAPFWSLAIEEQFYLLWPTAIRRVRTDRIAFYAACLAGFSFVLRCSFGFMGHSNYHLTPLRCDGLALGALLAVLKCSRVKLKAVYLLSAGGCGIFCLILCTLIFRYPFGGPLRELGTVLLCIAIVGLCVEKSGSPWLSIMRSRTLLFFAEISYALYIFHLFIFRLYDRYVGVPTVGNQSAFWVRIAVLFGASVAVSIVSRYLVELPILSLRTRVLSHPRKIDPAIDPPLPLAQM